MCAVIGYSGPGGVRAAERLVRLLEQSKIRGLHAFGLAYFDERSIVCHKFKDIGDAKAELYAVALAFVGEPLKLIAHCRYSTSGDWHDEANNQPIVINRTALAFNGCIHMGTTAEWAEAYGFVPETDNDGEIFLRKVLDGEPWEKWVRDGAFSFAGTMLHLEHLVALRNDHRPLYHYDDGDAHFIGSTMDIFSRAGFGGAPHYMMAGKALVL
jgi:glutamine phosphoribosylpyrophosphate amidotransferase